jgi:Trk-type K+ transport system membrane component
LATLALMATTGLSLQQTLFEALSAFGTVGLSTGITPDLDAAGQLIVIALMFLGRTARTRSSWPSRCASGCTATRRRDP